MFCSLGMLILSSVWGDVDLTGYVGCRDGVTVGFEMNSQTGGEGLGF